MERSKNGQLDESVGKQSLAICLVMLLNVAIGFWFGEFGLASSLIVAALSLGFGWTCWRLQKDQNRQAALRQMFASFIYLPIALIAIYLDRLF